MYHCLVDAGKTWTVQIDLPYVTMNEKRPLYKLASQTFINCYNRPSRPHHPYPTSLSPPAPLPQLSKPPNTHINKHINKHINTHIYTHIYIYNGEQPPHPGSRSPSSFDTPNRNLPSGGHGRDREERTCGYCH